jgi:hypothetical protein
VLTKYNDKMDVLITQALKAMESEAEQGMPNLEDAWSNFEAKMQQRQSKPKKAHKIFGARGALIACAALIIILTVQGKNVVAFKDEVFQWIGRDAGNGTIIVEKQNPQIEEGLYTDLSLREAQEATFTQ